MSKKQVTAKIPQQKIDEIRNDSSNEYEFKQKMDQLLWRNGIYPPKVVRNWQDLDEKCWWFVMDLSKKEVETP